MIVVILLIISWIYIIFGIIGIFKSSQLYPRLLSSSTIDTVALLTILIALMIAYGLLDFFPRIVDLKSTGARIPLTIVYSFMFIGAILWVFFTIYSLLVDYRKDNN